MRDQHSSSARLTRVQLQHRLKQIRRIGIDRALEMGLLPPIAGGSLSAPNVPAGAGGQPAIHTLTSTATGGTIKVSLAGTSTPALTPTTLTGAQLQSAIQNALGQYQGGGSGAGAATITATGNAGGPWVVTIPAQLITPLNANSPLTVDNSLATGGTVVDAVTQEGIVGGDELRGSGQVASEVPRVVGQAGQPAFATGWSAPSGSVALTAPVAAARTDWQPLQFFMDADGFVHIEGVAVWGAGAAALIFTLPAGYRPFQTHVDGPQIEVRQDGTVSYMGSTTGAGALDVGDISFRPAGV